MVSFAEVGAATANPPTLPRTLPPTPTATPTPTPIPSPTPDVWSLSTDALDALDTLGEEIIRASARLEADTQRLLSLIADFDAGHGWELSGHPGCAEWLATFTGIALGAARERVRTARALKGLPLLREAMGRGELSFSKLRAVTRIATADNEEELVPLALESSAAELERIVRGWRHGEEEELEREERRHQSRELSLFPDLDGMIQIRGRLTPELGALLMKAIEAASDTLYREEAREVFASEQERRQIAARRRADALGLLAERALEVGVGGPAGEGVRTGSQAERYQVILHVGPGTLAGGESSDPHTGPHANRSEIEPGIRVSAETSRRLTCDGSVVRVTHEADGSILDMGRRTRTIPPALRRALEVRDRGCRFPGCSSRFCEAHHIRHWAEGGETSLTNTLLLCRHHHRLLHEGRWTLQLTVDGRPLFRSVRGELFADYRTQPIRQRTVNGSGRAQTRAPIGKNGA